MQLIQNNKVMSGAKKNFDPMYFGKYRLAAKYALV